MDGLNVYRYLGNKPSELVDPMGTGPYEMEEAGYLGPENSSDVDQWTVDPNRRPALPRPWEMKRKGNAAAQAARNALAQVHERHVGYLYYESGDGWLTGLRYLIWDKLNAALYWLDDDDFKYCVSDPGAFAEYYPWLNDMRISRGDIRPYVVMHESIHAYNDWVDKYQDARSDEGLAYAASRMAEQLERLQRIETELQREDPDIELLRTRWRGAWLTIDVVGFMGSVGTDNTFTITEEDVRRVNSHLAFRIRCSDIARLYNEHSGAERACVEFLCEPNAQVTKGDEYTGLPVMNELHDPFK